MKLFFLLISLFCLNVGANEIERIEKVLSDITQLRKSYEKSQDELSKCRFRLSDEKQKNEILLQELKKLENEIEYLNNKIKTSKKSEKKEKSEIIKKVIIKEKIDNCSNIQIKKDDGFPKLQLRKEFLSDESIDTTPHTYRLLTESAIYDAIDGEKIEEWEAQSSFTSNYKSGQWIKITGYFKEKTWHKAHRELWVNAENTKQR